MQVITPHFTLQETATALNVSVRTVRRAIDRGELTAVRFGPRVVRVPAGALTHLGVAPTFRPSAEQR